MTILDRKISNKSSFDRTKSVIKTTGFKLQVTKIVTSNLTPNIGLVVTQYTTGFSSFTQTSSKVVTSPRFVIIYVSLRKRDNENDKD